MSSHLEKTHAKLKEMGYIYAKVEYFNPWSKTTIDLFGLHDTLAFHPKKLGVFGINSCGEDVAAHINKYLIGYAKEKLKINADLTTTKVLKTFGPNECLKPWLESGNRFELWGWRIRKHAGTKPTWQLRRVEFILFANEVKHREVAEETEGENENKSE